MRNHDGKGDRMHGKRIGRLLEIAVLAAGMAAVAGAQQEDLRTTPTVRAFQKNKDAVVSITGKQLVRESDPLFWFWGDDFPWRPRYQAAPFLGSGFVVDERGYIVTNDHVVRGALEVTVDFPDRAEGLPATVIAEDREADIALVRVEPDRPLTAVELGRSDDLMIGEPVLAIGNPFGYQHTLTEGIISAIHRDLQIEELRFGNLVQISAPINPGNSGGPLLNIYGQVIGMNTAIRKAAQGIGFAIPVDELRRDLAGMVAKRLETVDRVDLGFVAMEDPCMPSEGRIVVESVREGSAADEVGLAKGDVLVAKDGQAVHSAVGLYLDLLEAQAGATIRLAVRADGSGPEREVRLALRARPKPDPHQLATELLGLEVGAMPNERQGRRRNLGGLLITQVESGGPAENAGIAQGDILIGINGKALDDVEAIGYALEGVEAGEAVNLSLQRVRETGWRMEIYQFERSVRTREKGQKRQERWQL